MDDPETEVLRWRATRAAVEESQTLAAAAREANLDVRRTVELTRQLLTENREFLRRLVLTQGC